MIVYKYVGFEAGLKILQTQSLGFSHLEDFNDPFEGLVLGLLPDAALQVVTDSTRLTACKNRFSRKYAVLSLTRAPLNPLMWSHYADSYKGLVIGIDTEKAGLEDGDQFIIPSTKGEMIYLRTAPKNINHVDADDLMAIGNDDELNSHKRPHLLKHGFLYKMQDWAYEEEIRVVKNMSKAGFPYHRPNPGPVIDREAEIDGKIWTRVQLETRPIYLTEVPQEAFVEVYLGDKAYIDQERKQKNKAQRNTKFTHIVDSIEILKAYCHKNQIPLYRVGVDKENLSLISRLIPCVKE